MGNKGDGKGMLDAGYPIRATNWLNDLESAGGTDDITAICEVMRQQFETRRIAAAMEAFHEFLSSQQERCECHDCTQARYRGSFQWQMDQATSNTPTSAPALSPGVTSEQEQTCQNCGKPVFFHGDTWYHVNGSDVMSCGPANVPREQWVRLPDEQTWYWHWNGEDLAVPHIYSVMTSHSGRSDRYFVAYPDSRWCDELGGWWLKIDRPNVPSREYQASLPARPELDKDEGGRCPECHSPDPTKMIDPFNNELIDNTGPYMQCQHPFHSASGREKGGLG